MTTLAAMVAGIVQRGVGFADVVTPHPNEIEFQTILEGSSKPCIRVYPPETVIAEKFQAMVDLGMANSRLKDFYDLWFMASTMEFDYGLLMEAITCTFKNRGTHLPESTSPALTEEFAAQKQVQWVSFLSLVSYHRLDRLTAFWTGERKDMDRASVSMYDNKIYYTLKYTYCVRFSQPAHDSKPTRKSWATKM